MFLRVRGRGASAENSQATVMHLRGFRHIHAPPPAGSYRLLSLSEMDAAAATTTTLTRPHRFSHFSMGVQSDELPPAHRAALAAAIAGEDAAAASATTDVPDSTMAMLWKEVWNVYDISYDEVALLPSEDFTAVNQLLREVASAAATPSASVAGLATGFSLPTTRTALKKAVVCTHYCAKAVLDAAQLTTGSDNGDTDHHHHDGTASAAVPKTLLVLDLRAMPTTEAGNKLAVEMAWLAAYAALRREQPLLRAAAVVVCFPFDVMPSAETLTQLAEGEGEVLSDAAAAARMVLEMMDFLGEHLALMHYGCLGALQPLSPALHAALRTAPPVAFVGKDAAALLATLRALEPLGAKELRVLVSDHHKKGEGNSHARALAAEVQSWSTALSLPAAVDAVPLEALCEGEEEEWDAYTAQENARLNFCPCCSSCQGHSH